MTPDQLCKLSALVHNDDTAFVAIALLVFSFQPSDVQWAQRQHSSAPNNGIENTTRPIMSDCRLFMYDLFPFCKPTKLLCFHLKKTSFTQSLQQTSPPDSFASTNPYFVSDMAPSNTMPQQKSAPGLITATNEHKKATAVDQSDSSFTPLGQLVTLPPEIRVMIYQNLIKSGSVAFLGTSSAIYNEAIPTLDKEGIYHLEFNVFKVPTVYPSQSTADKILNLQIRVNLTNKSPDRNYTCITFFNEWLDLISGYDSEAFLETAHPTTVLQTPRKTCEILIDCHPNFVAHLPPQAFEVIGTLTGFETLILAIANDTEDSLTRVRSLTYSGKPDPRRRVDLALHGKANEQTLRAYEVAKMNLEDALGPSKWVRDERGAHLEFQPREFDRGLFYEPEEWLGEFFHMVGVTNCGRKKSVRSAWAS